MRSVTEQNHLHYSGVMSHCFRLVLWWPPTPLPLPLFCYSSVSAVSVQFRIAGCHWAFIKGIFSIDYSCISASIHPSSSTSIVFCSVKALLHHLSLMCWHSYFFLWFCVALRCCCLSAHLLLLYYLCIFAILLDQITAALCPHSYFAPVACWSFSGAFWGNTVRPAAHPWYLKTFLIDCCVKNIVVFPHFNTDCCVRKAVLWSKILLSVMLKFQCWYFKGTQWLLKYVPVSHYLHSWSLL